MNFCPLCASKRLRTNLIGFVDGEPDPNSWFCDNCGFVWKAVVDYPDFPDPAPLYNELDDLQLIDAIVEEAQNPDALETKRCLAGWAMYARLRKLRKELDHKQDKTAIAAGIKTE